MQTGTQTFRIGPIEISLPVVLAPLAGYSDLAYRRLCRRMGCPYSTTEMILDRCVSIRGRQHIALTATADDDHPTAGQIVGNEPETMAVGARRICEKGFDVIDLNFACPVNKALRRRRGGYLMGEPARVVEIVRAVVEVGKELGRPVTLKVRQRNKTTDGEENFWRIAQGAREAGAAAVTVHARSVEQKYSGPADWDFLRRVKEQFPGWVVIGSGDVLTPESALAMVRQTGVDAAAVARGALGNPWFFHQVRDLQAGRSPQPPSLAEQRDVMYEHFAGAVELYGPQKAPAIMRKWGIRYARMHPQPKQVRMAFVAVKTPEDWHDVLKRYYPRCD
ncbi:MAG: tRNA-dihydrouridine synthase [Phycisphaerae bacterium]|nr:tRNA-dihydrouridine synthase [Phycisphaerae bacterium]